MKPVVIMGTGPVASLAHYYLTHDSDHEVAGFVVDRQQGRPGSRQGLPVVAQDALASRFPPDACDMFVAVGTGRSARVRAARYRDARSWGYALISYVSSSAFVAPGVPIGDNCFILEHTVVEPFSAIGDDVIIWGGCQVGHDSVVGDHSFLGAHALLAGANRVEVGCVVGENATVGDGVTLGAGTSIGAGALILTSTQPRQVCHGRPAKLLPIPSDRLMSI